MGVEGDVNERKEKGFSYITQQKQNAFLKFLRAEMRFIVLMTSEPGPVLSSNTRVQTDHRAAHRDARQGLRKAVASLLLLQDV